MFQPNPLLVQGCDVHLYLDAQKLQAVIEEDGEAVSLCLIDLEGQRSRASQSWVHLHEVHLICVHVHCKVVPKDPSEQSFPIQELRKFDAVFGDLSSNPLLHRWIFKVVPSYLIAAIASAEGSELFMADQFRLNWADDSACLGGYCANGEPLQSFVWHDLVLSSILQRRMLPIVVFLIEDEESTPSTTAILGLNADFISLEAGGQFEQVLITLNAGGDIRNEGDACFCQQFDDLNLIAQVIEQFGRGSPYVESVLLTELLSLIINQHQQDIWMGILGLHVSYDLWVFQYIIPAIAPNDAFLVSMLE